MSYLASSVLLIKWAQNGEDVFSQNKISVKQNKNIYSAGD